MPPLNWAHICQPRTNGGLGIRRATDFNRAMLAKTSAKTSWHLSTNNYHLA